MRPEELDRLLDEVHREEPVPDFDATWRRAEARVGAREERGLVWRRALVPAAAIAALAGVVAVGWIMLLDASPAEEETNGSMGDRLHLALISDLEDMPSWEGPLDGIEDEWSFDDALFDEEDGENDTDSENRAVEDEEPAFALQRNEPGDDVYEASTDFLLEITIPAWNGAEIQRSLL